MKKLIIAAFAVVVALARFAAQAEDAILYWQVPTDGGAVAAGYNYAYLYAQVDGKGNVMLPQGGWAYDQTMASGGEMAAAHLAGIDGTISSFFVEYYNDNKQLIGKSIPQTLMELGMLGCIEGFQSNPPVTQTGTWAPGYTAVVPEPTSGLLMLMGLVGLALRRKRA